MDVKLGKSWALKNWGFNVLEKTKSLWTEIQSILRNQSWWTIGEGLMLATTSNSVERRWSGATQERHGIADFNGEFEQATGKLVMDRKLSAVVPWGARSQTRLTGRHRLRTILCWYLPATSIWISHRYPYIPPSTSLDLPEFYNFPEVIEQIPMASRGSVLLSAPPSPTVSQVLFKKQHTPLIHQYHMWH